MIIASLALALSAAATAPAPEMRVQISDLDFSRPEQARTFIRRADAAADAFCDQHRALVTPPSLLNTRVCETEMRRFAINRLDRERWTAAHRAALELRRAR
ncbi:UrcA family protein [Brevundimonas sp.]|uniref:UrcA family protein n=1 Tax=Brevundimonas sp. TaxID=1871086 RepID=UPI003D6D82B4